MSGTITAVNDFGANVERFNDYVAELSGPSEYDHAFFRTRLIYQEYYLLDLDNALVYCIIEPVQIFVHLRWFLLDRATRSRWDDLLVTGSFDLVHRYHPEKVYLGEAMLDEAVLDWGD